NKIHSHRVARRLIADAVINAVLRVAWVTLNEELRGPFAPALHLHLEVDVRRQPAGIAHRLERAEVILASGTGEESSPMGSRRSNQVCFHNVTSVPEIRGCLLRTLIDPSANQ